MEMDQSLGNQMDQEHPIAETISTPKNWLDFTLIAGGQLCWISWLLASGSFLQGFWTLPFGLAFLPLQFLSFLCLVFLVFRKRYFLLPLLFINIVLIGKDRGWSVWQSKTKTSDISVLTWNIQGFESFKNKYKDCVSNTIQEWIPPEGRYIILLQEMPKNRVSRIESKLGLSCEHITYKSNWALGVLVCADEGWIGRAISTSPLDTHGYRYLFTELTDKGSQRSINVLNIHLQSITKVAVEDKVKGSGDLFTAIKLGMKQPKEYLNVLTEQNLEHQESIINISNTQSRLKDPSIIAGDFNAPPTAPIHRDIRRLGFNDAHLDSGWGWGFTTSRLGLIHSRIDYLYATEQLQWNSRTSTIQGVDCSDHLPVRAQLSGFFD